MSEAFQKHYGVTAVSRGLRHFFIGKGFKIVSSLALVIILARYLQKPEYAAYISFQGLIAIAGVFASIGIQPVLFRFLPELRASGNNLMMYRLLTVGMVLRLLVVILVFIAAYLFVNRLAEWFKFEEWLWLAPFYFALGVIHLCVITLSQSLESLLWQKEAQYSLAVGSLLKVVGVVAAVMLGKLNIYAVVIIELSAEGVLLVMLVANAIRRWRKDGLKSDGSFEWWRENSSRVLRYGIWGFLVSQTGILYGSGPNRMMTARHMPVDEVAVFGAADSFLSMVRRLMPTRLLIGLIRPVFVAKYSMTRDFNKLVDFSNMIYRLNMLVFSLPIVFLILSGEQLFNWLTNDKYGAAGPLLGGFFVILIAESMSLLLELIAQAVEKYQVVLYGNMVRSASLFAVIPLFEHIGLWALVIANLVGTILANILTIKLLKRNGYVFRLKLIPVLRIIINACVAGALGWWVQVMTSSLVLSSFALLVVYALLFIVNTPFEEEEVQKIKYIGKRIFRRKQRYG